MVSRFVQVYKDFWRHFFDLRGQTSQKDFLGMIWWNFVIYLIIFGYIMFYKQREGAIFGIFVLVIYSVAAVIPLVTLLFRRYQSVGISGWWQLGTGLLPIVLLLVKSKGLHVTWLSWVAAILLGINVLLLLLPDHWLRH